MLPFYKKGILSHRTKCVFLTLLAFITLVLCLTYHVKPVRNVILSPVLPYSWRIISTSDLLRMNSEAWASRPGNVTDLINCPTKSTPVPKHPDVTKLSKLVEYPKANTNSLFFQNEDHAGFLPALSRQDRLDVVWMYLVLAHALKQAGVVFFFIHGSLIGVYRHAGAIPWDTDTDLAVNVSDWRTVRRVLSCIDGFRLKTKQHMHWKFYMESKRFPFIDLFFFTENQDYIWAVTHYELNTLLYPKTYVFPLTTAWYEGIRVPVPARVEQILQHEFGNIERCVPQNMNYKTKVHNKKITIMCSELTEVYPLNKFSQRLSGKVS